MSYDFSAVLENCGRFLQRFSDHPGWDDGRCSLQGTAASDKRMLGFDTHARKRPVSTTVNPPIT
jgi:hypothetical protein